MTLQEYLCDVRSALKNIDRYETVHVVIGNESCDLDSAVSAITYAYYLSKIVQSASTLVVPVLNIPREDYAIRIDSVYVLTNQNIASDHVTCRDDLDLERLYESGRLKVTLVDCNVFPEEPDLDKAVVEVVDHHSLVREPTKSVRLTVENVGSCCTLVAEKLTNDPSFKIDKTVAGLLHSTILTDTINLNPDAKKVTPKDIEYIEKLERHLGAVDRKKIFDEIQVAKADVSGLTTQELLRKDLKYVKTTSITIAMSSVPVHLQKFLARLEVAQDLRRFSSNRNADAIVVMTTSPAPSGGCIERQLGIYSPVEELRKKISNNLLKTTNPPLELQPMKHSIPEVIAFIQGNIAASRKQVLPLIRAMFK